MHERELAPKIQMTLAIPNSRDVSESKEEETEGDPFFRSNAKLTRSVSRWKIDWGRDKLKEISHS